MEPAKFPPHTLAAGSRGSKALIDLDTPGTLKRVKALQLTAHGSPGTYRFAELPEPAPGPGEVQVEVMACGLNRLDLWLEQGALPTRVSLPRVPGAEIAGRVAALGTGVSLWAPGDRVAIQSNLFCGSCEFCARGEESLCLHSRLLGVEQDGGLAGLVVVNERSLVRLPDDLPYPSAAALILAASTAMRMLTRRCEIRPGDWVVVMGANSGVGSAAVQIARGLGARVIATGSSPEKLELARRLGADWVLDHTDSKWPVEARKLTEKRGADVVVEHLGGPYLGQAFHCLRRGGTVVTCGATAGREVGVDLWPFFVKQQRLVGSYGRDRTDLLATLDWAARGRLQPVVDRVYPLDEAPQALDRLRRREALGKVLVVPS